MPGGLRLGVCCCAFTIGRLTGCRGASLCRMLRRRGLRWRGGPCRRWGSAARRCGGGGIGLRRGGGGGGGAGGVLFWGGWVGRPPVGRVEGCLVRAREGAGRAGQRTLALPGGVAGPLLTRVPAAFHGGINDVLLTALVVAIADWSRRRGAPTSRAVVIDLEGHGREEPSAGVDLSRTVGWLTSVCPVRLDIGGVDLDEALAGGAGLWRGAQPVKGP